MLVILVIAVIALAVLYFLGRKLEKRQVEQQQLLEMSKQTVSMLVIDKKKMKLSESAEKMTIPCLKKVWRIYDQDGKAMADLITMADEVVETQHGITLFDPIETWKECTYVNCTARCLSTPIYENGKRVYSSPSLDDIKKFCKAQVNTLWDEVKRFENPHRYYVDLSQKLWDTRSALLKKLSK